MPQYSFAKIASVIGVQIIGNKNYTITQLLIDSRGVTFPSDSLFFAIRGTRHDGHQYISDLYNIGVRCFVVETLPDQISRFADAGFIVVGNSLEALQLLAVFNRKQFNNKVVAITGSNGKTILKEWIFQAIHTEKYVVRSPKSFNSQVGVPLSLWQIEPQHDIAIIEAGISMPKEMEKLESMICPDIGIITNIGEPHQENFTDYYHKCAEKLKLFEHCKMLIYCSDHEIISKSLAKPEFGDIEKFSWSQQSDANLRIINVEKSDSTTTISVLYNQKTWSVEIPFIDEASLENAIHLIAFLLTQNYDSKTIADRLKHLTPVAMRLELKQGINNCTIINDTYNSDLGSLAIALDFLNQQNQHFGKTIILSDILQSGRSKELLYNEVSKLLTQKNITRLIGIGSDLLSERHQFAANSSFYASTNDFLENYQPSFFANETILLKGARSFEFEHILKVLEEKVHETVLEINLTAIVHNINYFRSKLNVGTKIVAMVKAFSYGSGSFEIANMLQFQRVDYLAVAFADEGVTLREAGITLPIMVMNPEKSSFHQIIKYNLEPEIYNFKVFEQFTKAVISTSKSNYPIHIKLDTGMHRLGFMQNDTEQLIGSLQNQQYLHVKSVFSHLAGSDESQFDDFTRSQISAFEQVSNLIINALPYSIMRHILNSAGIERFPEAQFDMVRLGIGMYGVSAVDQNVVRQASTLKTVILQIKQVEIGNTVGYSRRFKATKPTTIGILPIGYADGLHRILGNGVGKLLVNGQLAPIIGSICMDMCMIDLNDIDASEGDEVIVFGDTYPITELAKQMNSIPYEVLTSISRRVKRVYYQE